MILTPYTPSAGTPVTLPDPDLGETRTPVFDLEIRKLMDGNSVVYKKTPIEFECSLTWSSLTEVEGDALLDMLKLDDLEYIKYESDTDTLYIILSDQDVSAEQVLLCDDFTISLVFKGVM